MLAVVKERLGESLGLLPELQTGGLHVVDTESSVSEESEAVVVEDGLSVGEVVNSVTFILGDSSGNVLGEVEASDLPEEVLDGYISSLVAPDVFVEDALFGELPEVNIETDPVEELFYEGTLARESRMKLWGLNKKWGPLFKVVMWTIAFFADIMTFGYTSSKSPKLYAKRFRRIGFFIMVVSPMIIIGGHHTLQLVAKFDVIPQLLHFVEWGLFWGPVATFLFGWMLIFSAIRQQNGASFMVVFKPYYAPIPAYYSEAGPVFTIGHLLLSLKDTHTNMISFGGIGSGKCWAPGTRMLMFDGRIKCVEDLVVGDQLMGPDGKPRNVLSLARGRGKMYWVSERGALRSSGWGCNDVHMLTLKHSNGRPGMGWRDLPKDMRGFLKREKNPVFDGLKQVADLDSFGFNERTGRPIVPQDWADVELKGFLERTPKDWKGFGISRFWKMFRVAPKVDTSDLSGNYLVSEYYDWGYNWALSGKFPEWRPELFFRCSVEKRLAFLAGVLDVLGSVSHGCYVLPTFKGLDWVMLMARSVGLKVVEGVSGCEFQRGHISLDELPTTCFKGVKFGRVGGSDRLMYDWQVEETGEGDYYGFTVDGDTRILLADFTVTHNTAGFINPTLMQFFRKLNSSDHRSVYARWGGLVLDVKGDFIDFVIYCFKLMGRPLIDLVIIDPDISLVRYNPLDASDKERFADNGAAKLAAVQKIIGGGSDSKDKYWTDTSKSVIRSTLKVLQVLKPTIEISMADVGNYASDDAKMQSLLEETREKLMKNRFSLTEEDYNGFINSVDKLQNEWVSLVETTKSILKTTISQMLGPIVASTSLRRCFCRETSFSFKQVVTEAKVVLFRGSALDKDTRRLIAVCLKMDFMQWAQRRNGDVAARYGLAGDGRKRTILFVCDEYQEYVTAGSGGDGEFFAVSRSCQVCGIVATQHYRSLKSVVSNEDDCEVLINNLCTKVFLNSPCEKTAKLGEFLGSEYEKENHNYSLGGEGISLGKSGGSGGVSVSKGKEAHFKASAFANLLTMDMEKTSKRDWYSESIVYHYNHHTKSSTKMFRTKLYHCYPPRDYMATLSRNYDVVLRDRNAQRTLFSASLALQATGSVIRDEKVSLFASYFEEAKLDFLASGSSVPESVVEGISEAKAFSHDSLDSKISYAKFELEKAKASNDVQKVEAFEKMLERLQTELTSQVLASVLKSGSNAGNSFGIAGGVSAVPLGVQVLSNPDAGVVAVDDDVLGTSSLDIPVPLTGGGPIDEDPDDSWAQDGLDLPVVVSAPDVDSFDDNDYSDEGEVVTASDVLGDSGVDDFDGSSLVDPVTVTSYDSDDDLGAEDNDLSDDDESILSGLDSLGDEELGSLSSLKVFEPDVVDIQDSDLFDLSSASVIDLQALPIPERVVLLPDVLEPESDFDGSIHNTKPSNLFLGFQDFCFGISLALPEDRLDLSAEPVDLFESGFDPDEAVESLELIQELKAMVPDGVDSDLGSDVPVDEKVVAPVKVESKLVIEDVSSVDIPIVPLGVVVTDELYEGYEFPMDTFDGDFGGRDEREVLISRPVYKDPMISSVSVVDDDLDISDIDYGDIDIDAVDSAFAGMSEPVDDALCDDLSGIDFGGCNWMDVLDDNADTKLSRVREYLSKFTPEELAELDLGDSLDILDLGDDDFEDDDN